MTDLRPAATPETLETWKAEAHPSAKLVCRQALSALDRQLTHIDSLDAKSSYLAAANVVVMGAFLFGLAGGPVHDVRLQDFAGATLLFGFLGLASSVYTWWPRQVNAPPNPRGLRERYFNEREVVALQDIADEVVLAFEHNKSIENTKLLGIRFASFFLVLSVLAAVSVLFVMLVLGR